jgi:predicted  nucleic acid-binding Zn-ribbon protein
MDQKKSYITESSKRWSDDQLAEFHQKLEYLAKEFVDHLNEDENADVRIAGDITRIQLKLNSIEGEVKNTPTTKQFYDLQLSINNISNNVKYLTEKYEDLNNKIESGLMPKLELLMEDRSRSKGAAKLATALGTLLVTIVGGLAWAWDKFQFKISELFNSIPPMPPPGSN